MTTTMTRKPPRFCYRAFEFRNDDVTGDGLTLEGYAAVFGEPARIDSWEGTFDEQIVPGAFRRTLNARRPVLQFDHGMDARTGSVPIGAIRDIREDDHGLFVRARLFENDAVEPIRHAIAGGAIDGMSFRFRVNDDEWRDGDDKPVKSSELLDLLWNAGDRGPIRRLVREVELFELGPVVFPAYEGTAVGVRSMLAHLDREQRRRLLGELAGMLGIAGTEDRRAAPSHDTAVEEGDWDANAQLGRIDWPVSRDMANRVAAFVREDELDDEGMVTRSAVALPHHFVSEDGEPGAASAAGVRNALARLPQTEGLSDDDRAAVERHLRNHLPSDDETDSQEPSGPTREGTPDITTAGPTLRHSALYGEPAYWHLPGPEDN